MRVVDVGAGKRGQGKGDGCGGMERWERGELGGK